MPAFARTRGPHQHRRVGGGGALAAITSPRQREPDLAFGAFQTGFYLTAFGIAINRIELKKDPKAITLLDDFVNKLDPTTQAAGEKAAEPWLAAVKEPKG